MLRRKNRRQLELPLPHGRGGKRPGAGRKPKEPRLRPGVPHLRRPEHDARHPVHVTMKVRRELPRLRTKSIVSALRAAFRAGRDRFGFRLVHFSVQNDHLHLLCEAGSRDGLRRGVQGLAVRLARSLNRRLQRHGKVFADRYHSRELGTPTEVRNALRYVLHNDAVHAARRGEPVASGVDPFSSAAAPAVTCRARTWLLTIGWRRAEADYGAAACCAARAWRSDR